MDLSNAPTSDFPEFLEQVGRMASRVRNGMQVILLTIPSQFPGHALCAGGCIDATCRDDANTHARAIVVNILIRQFAASNALSVLDIFTFSHNLGPWYTRDGQHWTASKGYTECSAMHQWGVTMFTSAALHQIALQSKCGCG